MRMRNVDRVRLHLKSLRREFCEYWVEYWFVRWLVALAGRGGRSG